MLRVWKSESSYIGGPTYRLELVDIARYGEYGKAYVSYRFYTDDELIFAGDDYGVPCCMRVDGLESVASLLAFFSLCEGDVEDEYFDSYTPEQLEWRDAHAEDIAIIAMDIEQSLVDQEKRGWI